MRDELDVLAAARIRDDARAQLPAGDRRRGARLPPGPALEVLLGAFVEALNPHREFLATAHERIDLAAAYQAFRRALADAGMTAPNGARIRARRFRLTAEDCERRGDLAAAQLFYDLALRSDRRAGCRRRLAALRALEARGH